MRTLEISLKGIHVTDFRKSSDGYRWGDCEITSWNPFKLYEFVKNAKYEYDQNLLCVKLFSDGKPFSTPKSTGFVTRDISMFLENLKGLDKEFDSLTKNMTVSVSDVKTINGRPSAFYRFIIQETDKKIIKDKVKKLTDYFISKGAEIR